MHKDWSKYLLSKLVLPLVFLGSAAAAQAQADKPPKCPLTVKDVPFLSQLALGMSPEQLGKALNLPIKPEPKKTVISVERKSEGALSGLNLGTMVKHELFAGETIFRYRNDPAKNVFGVKGVEAIGLEFYKDQLYSFSMFYRSPDAKWKDASEFAQVVSEKFNLPKEFWRINPKVATITCQSFHLTANVSAENSLYLIFYDYAVLDQIRTEAKRLLDEQK